ncbi:hypothetical protein JNUCC1_03818 [Lentibacillus sp. JNUCC-1]|nr:hypothetical protein [Lentibacillus sp. JNUCC-1]
MQVALPRVLEAGKMQDQMLKQHQQFQDNLAQTHTKRQIMERAQVNNYDHVKNHLEHPKEHYQKHLAHNESNQADASKRTLSPAHPFLGNTIDLSR